MATTASGWCDYPFLQPSLTSEDGRPREYPAEADATSLAVRYARQKCSRAICEVGFRKAEHDTPGFRTRATVEHACFRLAALGVSPRIEGDLSTEGGIDDEGRRTLAEVNSGLKFKDPWRRGARTLADIAVLNPDLYGVPKETGVGMAQILEEGGHQFDVLDVEMDFSPYRVVIFPDWSYADEKWVALLKRCASGGGSLIAMSRGTEDHTSFAMEAADTRGITLREDHYALYAKYATPLHKRAVLDAVAKLLPEPLLRHDGPSTLFTSVLEQPQLNRWVIHLIYYQPQRRAAGIDVIDSYVPLYDVKFSLRAPKPVRQIALRPQHHDKLDFWERAGRTEFVVQKMAGHLIVEVEFAE